MSRARLHLHSAGSSLSRPLSLFKSSCPYLRGNSSSLETNVTISGQIYKYSSWHQFRYSQVDWWSSFTCQAISMAWVTSKIVDSQRGRVPTQVHAGRPDNEEGVGGMGPSLTKMWRWRWYTFHVSNQICQTKAVR